MIKYLYVPEEKNPIDYIKHAKDNGCLQIIHGYSDLIKDFIPEKNEVLVIKIPQIRQLITDKNIYAFGDDMKFTFIDEWLRDDKYIYADADILYIDIDDPNKIEKVQEIRMSYDGEYSFNGTFSPEKYGEYIISVSSVTDDGKKKKILSKEIIVYNKEGESNNGTETFSFEL